MRKLLLSSAMIVGLAAPTFAGGLAGPDIEPEPFVVPAATGSLGGYGAAAALIGGAALIAILASDDDDGGSSSTTTPIAE